MWEGGGEGPRRRGPPAASTASKGGSAAALRATGSGRVAHREHGTPFVAGWDAHASARRGEAFRPSLFQRAVALVHAVEFEILALASFCICVLVLRQLLAPAGGAPSTIFSGEKLYHRVRGPTTGTKARIA